MLGIRDSVGNMNSGFFHILTLKVMAKLIEELLIEYYSASQEKEALNLVSLIEYWQIIYIFPTGNQNRPNNNCRSTH